MPYRDGSAWPGPGDDDMADFIVDVYEPFLTDAKGSGGLGWISQNPDVGVGGGGTHPNYQRLFSRGSIGTEAPPFLFVQTTAKTLFMFSGNDVNTAQEPYDQPGNPMNQPVDASFSDPAANSHIGGLRCLVMPTMIGPYDDYWLFGGPTGEYCHCVVKVNSRQYRHFHVGMLTPLHSDLNSGVTTEAFYLTNHRWSWLDPDKLRGYNEPTNTVSYEHKPYNSDHHLPFRNNNSNNVTAGGDLRSTGMWVWCEGYGSLGFDWWMMFGDQGHGSLTTGFIDGRAQNTAGLSAPRSPFPTQKSVGDVNNTDNAVLFGAGHVSGYDQGLGAILFATDPTFTTDGVALIPIYVSLPSDFSSDIRWAPIGQIPDVYRVNMKNLDAEQVITVGSDEYVVFPIMNKDSANTLAGEGYSGYEGLAYKKITANAS